MLSSLPSRAQIIDTLILKDKISILFDSDAWKLNNEEINKLDSLLSMALKCDTILLEGHTDKIGSQNYNQKLSAKRVKAVKDELIKKDLSESRITTRAHGELLPARLGDDEYFYKYNRRVIIHCYTLEKRRRLKGKVEEESSNTPLLAKVKVTGKNFIDSTFTTNEGEFSIAVPDNGIYKLDISASNHFFKQIFIRVSPKDSNSVTVDLPEIKTGSIYTLPNFNFKGDLPILLPKSIPTIELLYELLANSDYCIEIKGHINLPNQPDCKLDTRHYKLSVDRANMVHDHMVSRGIESQRMLPKGYGNWEMLFPKANVESVMAKNRRVEIKIIDCASSKLNSDIKN
jgi:outer membrane protein OmpA-like peptidoglycan-associated protein